MREPIEHLSLPESQWPTESIPTDPEAGKYEIGTRAKYRRLAKYIDSQDEPRKPPQPPMVLKPFTPMHPKE